MEEDVIVKQSCCCAQILAVSSLEMRARGEENKTIERSHGIIATVLRALIMQLCFC